MRAFTILFSSSQPRMFVIWVYQSYSSYFLILIYIVKILIYDSYSMLQPLERALFGCVAAVGTLEAPIIKNQTLCQRICHTCGCSSHTSHCLQDTLFVLKFLELQLCRNMHCNVSWIPSIMRAYRGEKEDVRCSPHVHQGIHYARPDRSSQFRAPPPPPAVMLWQCFQ